MRFNKYIEPKTCQELLLAFKERTYDIKGEKLIFTGIGDKDVYNITAPFEDDGEMVIAGRVEARDSEHSEVRFFILDNNIWQPKNRSKKFTLQDPFVITIKGELVFGGVEIFPHPEIENALWYRTVFYRGRDTTSLHRFAAGPDGMKDIRLIELKDGKIGVFTRPQGKLGGRGKIGFTKINSIDELNADNIMKAKIFEKQFVVEEWGGTNEIHLLKSGLLGVLGHIASFDEDGNRHYFSMTFAFNPETYEMTEMKIIATRSNFLEGSTKRPDLMDVIFSGGLIRHKNKLAEFYAGVSDAEAHKIVIPDPFMEYEE
ncbi:MAG: DUF1861 family protein [Halanaerobiales bacterium]|nr:DUF1861 family protein [Halanaerobiales bacterium]